jgi:2-octaprenyl-6-methoxyphenol hydroxylase
MAERIYDAAIIGAGPTGSTLALGLAQLGLQVLLVDARDPKAPKRKDGRNFAIVTGSWHLLASVGICDELEGMSQALHGLEAVDGGTHYFGQPSVHFSEDDLDRADPDETLGYMVRAENLQAALDKAVGAKANITALASAYFERADYLAGHVEIGLKSGDIYKTRVLLGADGMKSPVRESLGIGVEGRDYGKSVFTANVQLEQPHNGIARQLFLPEGPFATLPLTGNRANLAWYLKRGAAEALAARPVAEAEAELNHRFAKFAGPMKIEGDAGSYPLILQLARAMVGTRGALVGDAVRRVNPLAGQGLNQGFRDVAALIEVFGDALACGADLGSGPVLERYSEMRRFNGHSSALGLDGIDRLFSNDSMLTKPVRTLGMLAAQHISPLRRLMTRHASATEDGVPSPMRGGMSDW